MEPINTDQSESFGAKEIQVEFNNCRVSLGTKKLNEFKFSDLESEIRHHFHGAIPPNHQLRLSFTSDGIRRHLSGNSGLQTAMRSSDSTLLVFVNITNLQAHSSNQNPFQNENQLNPHGSQAQNTNGFVSILQVQHSMLTTQHKFMLAQHRLLALQHEQMKADLVLTNASEAEINQINTIIQEQQHEIQVQMQEILDQRAGMLQQQQQFVHNKIQEEHQ